VSRTFHIDAPTPSPQGPAGLTNSKAQTRDSDKRATGTAAQRPKGGGASSSGAPAERLGGGAGYRLHLEDAAGGRPGLSVGRADAIRAHHGSESRHRIPHTQSVAIFSPLQNKQAPCVVFFAIEFRKK